jgi:hypothetical protein
MTANNTINHPLRKELEDCFLFFERLEGWSDSRVSLFPDKILVDGLFSFFALLEIASGRSTSLPLVVRSGGSCFLFIEAAFPLLYNEGFTISLCDCDMAGGTCFAGESKDGIFLPYLSSPCNMVDPIFSGD